VALFRSFVVAALLSGASWAAGAAVPPGTITILEGEAQIFRGLSRFVAAEGVRLAFGDIVETGENTFVQIELSDQSTLQLGGISRVMINGSSGRKPEHWVYLMNGWAKMSGAKPDPKSDGGYEVRAPLFDLAPGPGVAVLLATPIDVQLFVERGNVRLSERQRPGPQATLALKAGDTYRRKKYTRGTVAREATPDFLDKMPKYFRDTLPSRMDRFRDRDVQPREAPDFGYADVELWMKAEPAIRRSFVHRWKAKALRDAAFKSGIVANMSSHPEWDPILFPEKYQPKEPPMAAKPRTMAQQPPAPSPQPTTQAQQTVAPTHTNLPTPSR
jgi:FecR protein